MKRISKVMSAIMLLIAIVIATGCTKPDEPNNNGGGGDNNGGGNNGGNGGGGSGHYYTISVSVYPTTASGNIIGAGTYQGGQSCTLQAIANYGYSFSKWTDIYGSQVSNDENYTFIVNGDRDLVAFFNTNNYTINATANPSNGGSISGGGVFFYGQICRLTATAASGYTFANWTVNDTVVSTNALYHFAVDRNRTLVANFVYLGGDNVLEGAINGKFTINASGDQVYFSQGNLQYTKSTQTWSFMDNQYDLVETANQNIGYNYENQDVVSLFGYGTSGWNFDVEGLGLLCFYHPWNTDYLYGNYFYGDLKGFDINADWGIYNAISNGGNQAGLWRTLTRDEWVYVFDTRNTASGSRFAKACVNSVNGVIILPDEWNNSFYSLNSTDTNNASFTSNIITASQWGTLEQYGAVFLPAAGWRHGISIDGVNVNGYYWSASEDFYNNGSSLGMRFSDSYLYPPNYGGWHCFMGSSVRLVHDAD